MWPADTVSLNNNSFFINKMLYYVLFDMFILQSFNYTTSTSHNVSRSPVDVQYRLTQNSWLSFSDAYEW